MAKESGTKGVVDTRPGPGSDTSLDELAKGLASGTISRGKALRLMGSALVGGALASVPGVAWATPGGNNACAQFCKEVFPIGGPERGECISAAAQGQGLCFECGPKAADTMRMLCGQVCCASGETCSDNGQCVTSPFCTEANSQPNPGAVCGTSPSGTPLAGQNCVCRLLVEGGGFCAAFQIGSCSKACNSSNDCPEGTFCNVGFNDVPGFVGLCVATCESGDPRPACNCPDGRPTCNNVCCLPEQSCVSVGQIRLCYRTGPG
jgi:hypothetical protein